MSRKIILIKQELLLLVYELNRSGLLAENEKIRPILAQLEKLLLCDLSPSTNDSELRKDRRSEERFSRNAETDLVCRLLLEKKKQLRDLVPALFEQRGRSRANQHDPRVLFHERRERLERRRGEPAALALAMRLLDLDGLLRG